LFVNVFGDVFGHLGAGRICVVEIYGPNYAQCGVACTAWPGCDTWLFVWQNK
jgi:hypothetical protein